MPFLIRAEGVNLSAVLSDTSDLSTIRGGGLMLLDAANGLEKATGCNAISTGASAALLKTDDKHEAVEAVKAARQYLQKAEKKHFTFVVNAMEFTGDNEFPLAEAAVLAANRWQQMQAPSLAIPTLSTKIDPSAVCEVGGVRPYSCDIRFPDEVKKPGSQSVHDRREQGRRLRQTFYNDEIAKLEENQGANFIQELCFTDDLHTLAGGYPEGGNLNDKFAVLYMDGNNFGSIARACKIDKELEKWDKEIKKLRRKLLLDILRAIHTDSRWHAIDLKTGKPVIRLETLLWGGDELMFAVPAWLGWPLLDFIFRHTKGWQYDGKELTHGVGLVFCHVKAPIQRVTTLAKSLAEEAKEATNRMSNAACWLALESFDHVGTDFSSFLARRYHHTINAGHWVLSADHVEAINTNMKKLKSILPRSQIVQAALSAVCQPTATDDKETLNKVLANAYEQLHVSAHKAGASAELLALWNTLKGTNGKNDTEFPTKFPDLPPTSDEHLAHIAAWAQLAELWDYAGLDPI